MVVGEHNQLLYELLHKLDARIGTLEMRAGKEPAAARGSDVMEESNSYRVVKLWTPGKWKECPRFSTTVPSYDWLGGRIYEINQHTSKWTTKIDFQLPQPGALPEGMRIYQTPPDIFAMGKAAFDDVKELFQSERTYRGKYQADLTGSRAQSNKTILLYPATAKEDEKAAFQIREGLKILEKRGFLCLKQVCEMYHATFCRLMQIDPREAECYMNIMKYVAGEGFKVHVDGINNIGVHGKKNLPGPIFNIAMGHSRACRGKDGSVLIAEGEKALDIIPTLANDSTLDPVRVIVKQWSDVLAMDGFSRLGVQHAIPFDNQNEMYTLAFKYAGVPRRYELNREILLRRDGSIKRNEYLNTEIVPMIVDPMPTPGP